MLQGKTALVTGSTSGIGLAIAERLAESGCQVVLNGFSDAAAIEATRAALAQRTGVRVTYSGADMSKPEQIETMVRDAEVAFGGIDVLVNNAGIQHVSPVDEFPAAAVGADPRHQPVVQLLHRARFAAGHEAARLGPHCQHRLGARPRGLAVQVGRCGGQAWRAGVLAPTEI